MPYPIKRPVILPIGPSIAYLQLTRGFYSLIDSDDAEWLGKWNWSAHVPVADPNDVRALRGGSERWALHRQILGITDRTVIVDHKNRFPLDNRRCNLRIADPTESSANRGVSRLSKLGEKGIGLKRGKFYVRLKRRGVVYRCGTFATLD